MEQQKIGKFIHDLRKEKEMTQKQLAELVGVSDKTISKWETGRGIPDTAIMNELCQVLGISINELLSGEKLSVDNYNGKAEENMVNLSDFLDTKLGMEYCCDDEEFYKEMLESYLSTNKYIELNKSYQEENWEQYRISVHALKSTSLSIGAVKVSEMAKELEMAAREGRKKGMFLFLTTIR